MGLLFDLLSESFTTGKGILRHFNMHCKQFAAFASSWGGEGGGSVSGLALFERSQVVNSK